MRLELHKVTVNFGPVAALTAVDLTVGEKEIVAVLGANGAGKSTLAKSILGIAKVQVGSIMADGVDIKTLDTAAIVALGISLVPEGRALFPRLTVWQTLQLGCYLSDKHELGRKTEKVFDIFPQLADRRHQVAGTLSGGEQQMLAIARALLQDPKLMILDEPSLGLAPKLYNLILQKILEINKSGCGILLIDQKASQALSASHRGYVLNLGRVEKKGTAAELLNDRDIQRIYLGALDENER